MIATCQSNSAIAVRLFVAAPSAVKSYVNIIFRRLDVQRAERKPWRSSGAAPHLRLVTQPPKISTRSTNYRWTQPIQSLPTLPTWASKVAAGAKSSSAGKCAIAPHVFSLWTLAQQLDRWAKPHRVEGVLWRSTTFALPVTWI